MANTSGLEEAFDWIRGELSRRFGVAFTKRSVRLVKGAVKTFNAVADDLSIVAAISNASGLTSGKKRPVAKIQAALSYLYMLSQTTAPRRLLVLTDPEFHRFVLDEVAGALGDRLEVICIELPPEVAARVKKVTSEASEEMS